MPCLCRCYPHLHLISNPCKVLCNVMYVLFRVAVKLQSTPQLLMSRPWKIISRDCRVRNKRIYFPSFHSSCGRISLPQFKYSNTFPVLNHKGRLRRLTVQKWKWNLVGKIYVSIHGFTVSTLKSYFQSRVFFLRWCSGVGQSRIESGHRQNYT